MGSSSPAIEIMGGTMTSTPSPRSSWAQANHGTSDRSKAACNISYNDLWTYIWMSSSRLEPLNPAMSTANRPHTCPSGETHDGSLATPTASQPCPSARDIHAMPDSLASTGLMAAAPSLQRGHYGQQSRRPGS